MKRSCAADARPYRPRGGSQQYVQSIHAIQVCDRCAQSTPQCRAPCANLNTREALIRPRIRKLIGTVALLTLVVVWSFLAMALAQIVLVRSNGLLDFAYYVVTGLGWVLPAMPLISWMSRGD
jgi:hypothetical protein